MKDIISSVKIYLITELPFKKIIKIKKMFKNFKNVKIYFFQLNRAIKLKILN